MNICDFKLGLASLSLSLFLSSVDHLSFKRKTGTRALISFSHLSNIIHIALELCGRVEAEPIIPTSYCSLYLRCFEQDLQREREVDSISYSKLL